MFGILPTLGSEAAAYVARHHSEVMRRLPENSTGQNVPHPMRILNVRVKRISVLFGVIVANCPARLHVLSVDARYDVSCRASTAALIFPADCSSEASRGR